ncbi:MAG: hypothetical protein RL199_1927, partial [Pseudomonadota bacterium]
EAEWERAARAGTTAPRYGEVEAIAWGASNASGGVKAVKARTKNPWNLFDLLGNVAEWTYDRYGEYADDTMTDPMGAEEGDARVVRGGSFQSPAAALRASARDHADALAASPAIGFRVVRSVR